MSNQNPITHKHRFDVWHDTLGMDVTPKKGKFETKIFFSDNAEWSFKNLWKMMSADVKANKNNNK